MPSRPRSPAELTVTVRNGVASSVRACLDDAQLATLLRDEEPAVGRERHRGRARNAGNHQLVDESGRHQLRLDRGARGLGRVRFITRAGKTRSGWRR